MRQPLARRPSGDATERTRRPSRGTRPRPRPRAAADPSPATTSASTSPGQSPRSIRALENLRTVCDEHLAGRYRVEVIDLLVNPALARGDEIVAVPTLVRKLPEPIRKIIGDLSDTDRVLVGLQVRPLGGDLP